jgi:hypothetical protein
MLLDSLRQEGEDPGVGGLPRLAPFPARQTVRVVELLDALEGDGLAAQG